MKYLSSLTLILLVSIILLAGRFEKKNLPHSPLLAAEKRSDINIFEQKKVINVTANTTDFSKPEPFEIMQGGAGTFKGPFDRNTYSQFATNLPFEDQSKFKVGNTFFRQNWTIAPSSTKNFDGLGPLFNARNCQACHIKDGRGHPPQLNNTTSMLIRLARDPKNLDEWQKINNLSVLNYPDPVYGGQIQDKSIPGIQPEATIKLKYNSSKVTLADNTVVELLKPTYSLTNLKYGPLDPSTTLSTRIANPMIGLGLIEAIHPNDIIALADPEDKNKNGISGRPNLRLDATSGKPIIGKFGWKAQNPTIIAQAAGALVGDMGLSSKIESNHYGDCTASQQECFKAPHGANNAKNNREVTDKILDMIVFYSQSLAVPARRNVDSKEVLSGKKTFYNIGCVSCHHPKFVTRKDYNPKSNTFQLIWPYSDFLLHDMGEGLEDNQQVGQASGREWRTAPLWGVGLAKTVDKRAKYLHDGRARNLTEAILWHSGEAETIKQKFIKLTKKDRKNLILFLESL